MMKTILGRIVFWACFGESAHEKKVIPKKKRIHVVTDFMSKGFS